MGILSIIFGASKRYWPYILGIIAIFAAMAFLNNRWKEYKKDIYNSGFEQAEKQYKDLIVKQNDQYRNLEKQNREQVEVWNRERIALTDKRVVIETKYVTDIQKQIVEKEVFRNSECVIPNDIIKTKNKIREEGAEVVQ